MGYFDHFAAAKVTRIGAWLEKQSKKKEYEFIAKFLHKRESEILEIGPGYGILANFFLEKGFKHYDVVEPNEMMKKSLSEIGIRRIKSYLIPPLNETDNSYDMIIMTDVLEHLNDMKDAQLFIQEAYRILNKDGMLMIASPDYCDWKHDFYNCDFSHNYVTTLKRTRQLMQDHGFNMLDYQYTYSCFAGIAGIVLNKIFKMLTIFSIGDITDDDKVYKLRLTFLRRFGIIGNKV